MTSEDWRAAEPRAVLMKAQGIIAQYPQWEPPYDEHWCIQQRVEADWAIPTIRVLQDLPPTDVLDLGGGYGTIAVAAHLLGHRVTVLDLFVPAPEVPGIAWLRGDLQDPDAIPEGPFGVVVMTEVLEHLSVDPLPVLRSIRARMDHSAWLLGSCPDPDYWPEATPAYADDLPAWTPDHQHPDAHMRLYPQDVLEALLRRAGLRVFARFGIGAMRARYYWMGRAERYALRYYRTEGE